MNINYKNKVSSLKAGSLIKLCKFRGQQYHGKLFNTWDHFLKFHSNNEKVVVGEFFNDEIGFLLDVVLLDNFSACGAKVLVNGISGWLFLEDLEKI